MAHLSPWNLGEAPESVELLLPPNSDLRSFFGSDLDLLRILLEDFHGIRGIENDVSDLYIYSQNIYEYSIYVYMHSCLLVDDRWPNGGLTIVWWRFNHHIDGFLCDDWLDTSWMVVFHAPEGNSVRLVFTWTFSDLHPPQLYPQVICYSLLLKMAQSK